MILHDSEDVLHPLELKFFNYLLPRKDLIQLPVFSLERHWYELVAGTYMDEFAESHGKDMLVREHISGVVPSAGVGTCFSRRAIRALCETTENQPFNTASLTEDYDIGNRLARMGMRSIFAVLPVEYVEYKTNESGATVETRFVMPLSVREFFPDTFITAYRQKSRWTLGIGLQSWEQIKFTGSWAAKYLLLRDRKGIVAAFISMLAYLNLLGFIAFHLLAAAGVWTEHYPSVFAVTAWFMPMMIFNGASLVNRSFHRAYFVSALYGWRQGLWSLPRMIVGNFVNFMAVMRAWRMFLRYLFLGRALVWDKTMHDFPSADVLAGQKRRIGELLTSWQAIDPGKLEQGLSEHQALGLPLGRVLVMNGWLDDETLAEAIAYQTGYGRAAVDLSAVWSFRDCLPFDLCADLRALYIGTDEHQRPLLAVAGPLRPQDMQRVTQVLPKEPVLRIVRESEIHAGLRHWREGVHKLSGEVHAQGWLPAADEGAGDNAPPLLGDLLMGRGLVDRASFELALSTYSPSLHGRIGAYLVDKGVVTREQVDTVLAQQRSHQSPLLPAEQGPPCPVQNQGVFV
jgi:bacteriophage N4 adsorption protein B